MATIVATLSVAERLKLPVFSDDRFVRALARGSGLPTFGTAALLDALVERGRLTEDEREHARTRLRLSGAIGLPATADEFLAEGRRVEWKLTPLLIAMLADHGLWFDTIQGTDLALTLLRAVFDDAPDEFDRWVARVVDASHAARPDRGHLPPVVVLLTRAWLNEDRELIARLTDAVERLRLSYGFYDIRDPVGWAAALFLNASSNLPEQPQLAILKAVLRKLDFPSQAALLQRLRIVNGEVVDEVDSTAEGEVAEPTSPLPASGA